MKKLTKLGLVLVGVPLFIFACMFVGALVNTATGGFEADCPGLTPNQCISSTISMFLYPRNAVLPIIYLTLIAGVILLFYSRRVRDGTHPT